MTLQIVQQQILSEQQQWWGNVANRATWDMQDRLIMTVSYIDIMGNKKSRNRYINRIASLILRIFHSIHFIHSNEKYLNASPSDSLPSEEKNYHFSLMKKSKRVFVQARYSFISSQKELNGQEVRTCPCV